MRVDGFPTHELVEKWIFEKINYGPRIKEFGSLKKL
jgi:hypothetical protein